MLYEVGEPVGTVQLSAAELAVAPEAPRLVTAAGADADGDTVSARLPGEAPVLAGEALSLATALTLKLPLVDVHGQVQGLAVAVQSTVAPLRYCTFASGREPAVGVLANVRT